jgi:hypothetical protein
MDRNMPGLDVGIDEVPDQTMSIPIEVDADQLPGSINHRAAAVPADRIRG